MECDLEARKQVDPASDSDLSGFVSILGHIIGIHQVKISQYVKLQEYSVTWFEFRNTSLPWIPFQQCGKCGTLNLIVL